MDGSAKTLEFALIARPWSEGKDLLKQAGISYTIEYTRPTAHFFSVDEHCLYVVRVKQGALPNSIQITLAGKQRKEV